MTKTSRRSFLAGLPMATAGRILDLRFAVANRLCNLEGRQGREKAAEAIFDLIAAMLETTPPFTTRDAAVEAASRAILNANDRSTNNWGEPFVAALEALGLLSFEKMDESVKDRPWPDPLREIRAQLAEARDRCRQLETQVGHYRFHDAAVARVELLETALRAARRLGIFGTGSNHNSAVSLGKWVDGGMQGPLPDDVTSRIGKP